MGGEVGLCQRQGWNVWRFICGRHANARSYRPAAAPGCHLSLPDEFGLLRRLDLSERRADAMVREFLDFGLSCRHTTATGRRKPEAQRVGGNNASRELSTHD